MCTVGLPGPAGVAPAYTGCGHRLQSLGLYGRHQARWASLAAQTVKNPPAVWEAWVQSLDWEDPLEEGMVTHSSVLPWRVRGAWRAAVPGVTEMLSRQDAFSCQPMLAPKAVVAGSYHSSADKQLWGREITGHAQGCKAGE